jgi:hypothetical protein
MIVVGAVDRKEESDGVLEEVLEVACVFAGVLADVTDAKTQATPNAFPAIGAANRHSG